jgi:hypothetical protein
MYGRNFSPDLDDIARAGGGSLSNGMPASDREAESHRHMEPGKWCELGFKQKVLDESLSFSRAKRDSGRKFRRQPTDFARHWVY